MNEISKERIEISGVEYTLFLNRKGLMAWEKYCKEETSKVNEMQVKYKDILNGTNAEITEDTNPFEEVEEDTIKEDTIVITQMFKKLYWVMLYTEHKLNITQVGELYDKACEEYGEEQLILLGRQMIEDMNVDKVSKQELKNLTALRQKK